MAGQDGHGSPTDERSGTADGSPGLLARPVDGAATVAIAVLVVNGPVWREKANVLARDSVARLLRGAECPGVTRPAAGRAPPRP